MCYNKKGDMIRKLLSMEIQNTINQILNFAVLIVDVNLLRNITSINMQVLNITSLTTKQSVQSVIGQSMEVSIMYKIRKNVFETNSSSMHSVSVYKNNFKLDPPNLRINNKNMVVSGFDDFGWDIQDYISQDSKLRYLLTMVMEYNAYGEDFEIYQDKDFKKIEKVVKDYCNCDGIEIDSEIKFEKYSYCGEMMYYWDFDGCIDHQSLEYFFGVNDFLNSWGVTIKEFIFSPNVVLHTDNDNH